MWREIIRIRLKKSSGNLLSGSFWLPCLRHFLLPWVFPKWDRDDRWYSRRILVLHCIHPTSTWGRGWWGASHTMLEIHETISQSIWALKTGWKPPRVAIPEAFTSWGEVRWATVLVPGSGFCGACLMPGGYSVFQNIPCYYGCINILEVLWMGVVNYYHVC